ncbi:TPA: ATP-binding protein [Clostridioides difficile]|nr:ATP-binding protein [Clostridioides difficile]HBH3640168.1 ATP-binding protein [Clostridioides difficile]
MNNIYVRILSIQLDGFKNVNHGKIDMPRFISGDYTDEVSDILGIYGQNGSGKTAIIDSLAFLKDMMMGKSLPKDTINYIGKNKEVATLKFKFYLKKHENEFLLSYEFSIIKKDAEKVEIKSEIIKFSKLENCKKLPESTLIKYDSQSKGIIFTPKYRYEQLSKGNKENEIKINVAKIVSIKEQKSFVFSEELRELWNDDEEDIMNVILSSLRLFAITDLFVIRNGHNGIITLDFAMPFSFKYEDGRNLSVGDMLLSLSEPTIFKTKEFDIFKIMIQEINFVIGALIPGLSIIIKEYGLQTTKDGKDGIRFELLSKRGEEVIPLRYESEGIKKIISILNLLIAMYNNPSVCVAVDELDAGVYEYLLGELLGVIQETGKGQFIFTSHNLRPLEMINKSSLIFTTTNPENRYIRLTNVKNNNNLRDLYLRSINLGGQKESIYEPTKTHEIRRTFRRAWRLLNE